MLRSKYLVNAQKHIFLFIFKLIRDVSQLLFVNVYTSLLFRYFCYLFFGDYLPLSRVIQINLNYNTVLLKWVKYKRDENIK